MPDLPEQNMSAPQPASVPGAPAAAVGWIWQRLPQALWIVTSKGRDRDAGLLATWVLPASLDPNRGRMIISLAVNHATTQAVQASGGFVLHWLSVENAQLAYRFAAGTSNQIDKFSGLSTDRSAAGHPRLLDACGWLECRCTMQLAAGDRVLFWGEIDAARRLREATPLTTDQWFPLLNEPQRALLDRQRREESVLHESLYSAWIAQQNRSS